MSTPALQTLIFDVDGTLADTESAHCNAVDQAFAEMGWDWTGCGTGPCTPTCSTFRGVRSASRIAGTPRSPRQRHPTRQQLVTLQKSRFIALKEVPCP